MYRNMGHSKVATLSETHPSVVLTYESYYLVLSTQLAANSSREKLLPQQLFTTFITTKRGLVSLETF